MAVILECGACGGQVVYDAGQEAAACVFCGALQIEAREPTEPIPTPDCRLVQRVERAQAEAQYREWAQASWWRPKALRQLRVELGFVYLPAFRFLSQVESHWAGLVSAATQSGKRPVSGTDSRRLHFMLPASKGIEQAELTEIQPFDEEDNEALEGDVGGAFELPAISEQAARMHAHPLIAGAHRSMIASEEGLLQVVGSAKVDEVDLKLFLLPVFVGAFRFRDQPWRFLVNAQTGEVVGKAPIDRLKVFLVVFGSLVAVGVAVALLG